MTGGGRIAKAAALIAVLTVLSRLAGFGRTVVFAATVGSTDLGDIYQTANTIPNIIFEIVAGGALASLVVPLLAAPVAAGDRRTAAATASALLTWTVAMLIPLAILLAVFARPVVQVLGNDPEPAALDVGTRMLRVFSIQLPLYGVGIVLTGVLHSYRRFAWPVLAPLLSSVTVMCAYLLFARLDGTGVSVANVSLPGEWALSVGTTVGVAVLTLSLTIPVSRLGLRFRPRWELGEETRRRAVGLAGAAVAMVTAQQLTLAYLIRLANGGPDGAVVLFTLAQTVFLLPWAVLAVPVSTTAYPILAAAEDDQFTSTLARTARAVVLLSWLGAAALIGLAIPIAHVLSAVTAGHPDPTALAGAIAWFAPGLLGLGLFSLLSRALYARHQARFAALATASGWLVTAVAGTVLATSLDRSDRIVGLAAAHSLGMLVLGAGLVALVARGLGRACLAGLGRTAFAGAVASLLAGGLGALLSSVVSGSTPGMARSVLAGMLAGAVVAAGFVAVALALDRTQTGALLTTVTTRLARRGVRTAGEARGAE